MFTPRRSQRQRSSTRGKGVGTVPADATDDEGDEDVDEIRPGSSSSEYSASPAKRRARKAASHRGEKPKAEGFSLTGKDSATEVDNDNDNNGSAEEKNKPALTGMSAVVARRKAEFNKDGDWRVLAAIDY